MRRRTLIAIALSDTPDVPDTPDISDTSNYLTIQALENGLTASLSTNACEYCVDEDGNWKSLAAGTATESINSGQTLSFRGNLRPTSSNGIGTFTISKKCNLKGNCMSMLFGDNAANNYSLEGKDYAFRKLFYGCTTLKYVSANFIPATTLATYCYGNMFYGCSSLTTAPALPATTLADYCYGNMFYGCTKLNYIKMLATDISANNCLNNWVSSVASTGTFIKNPEATWDVVGNSGVPSGWTVKFDGEEDANLITFTIDGIEYQAEEGMTWEEWIDSEYNTINAEVDGGMIYAGDIAHDFRIWISYDGGNLVYLDELIISDQNYMVSD